MIEPVLDSHLSLFVLRLRCSNVCHMFQQEARTVKESFPIRDPIYSYPQPLTLGFRDWVFLNKLGSHGLCATSLRTIRKQEITCGCLTQELTRQPEASPVCGISWFTHARRGATSRTRASRQSRERTLATISRLLVDVLLVMGCLRFLVFWLVAGGQGLQETL